MSDSRTVVINYVKDDPMSCSRYRFSRPEFTHFPTCVVNDRLTVFVVL